SRRFDPRWLLPAIGMDGASLFEEPDAAPPSKPRSRRTTRSDGMSMRRWSRWAWWASRSVPSAGRSCGGTEPHWTEDHQARWRRQPSGKGPMTGPRRRRACQDRRMMSRSSSRRRRPSLPITSPRAARLYRLVRFLAEAPRDRPAVLSELQIGPRTFYRELEWLKRCGIKVRQRSRLYFLRATAGEAEGRLPFPDPQLSFAEMAELARCNCPAGRRLADLLAEVIHRPEGPKRRRNRG